MKNISKMTGEELGKVLWDLFGGDDRETLEDGGYVEDNLADHYERADIAAISPETWAIAWDNYDRRRGGATMGRKGGKSRSDAKTAAARENGRKGGRPKVKRIVKFFQDLRKEMSDHDIAAGLGNGDIERPEWMATAESTDHLKAWDTEDPDASHEYGFVHIDYYDEDE